MWSAPFDKHVDVFRWMHADEMLLEVVKTRPQLACFGTIRCKAFVHARFSNMLSVDGFLMTIEVVDGGEADRASRTSFFDTSIDT